MEATYVGSVATLDSGTVRHADSGSSYLLASGSNVTARFNRAGGLGVLYGGAVTANVTRVFNMGNLYEPAGTPTIPVSNTYAIDASHNLAVSSAFVIDPATNKAPRVSPVADNIVHMRVQYGLDDGIGDGSVTFAGTFVAGDGLVDRFVPAATFNAIVPAPWQSLIALRVAIVARSAQPERPLGSDGTNCDATTDGTESTPGPDRRPRWSGSGIAGGALDVSASGDPSATSPAYWKCYRYRVFETIIPLRNWIWRSS
jgi:type IV pilus assembly protein PilW